MKKFFVLIKKEIQELLTLQMLAPLLIVILVFVFMGKIIGKETAKTKSAQPIVLSDLDDSSTSKKIIEILKQSNFSVRLDNNDPVQKIIEDAKQNKEKAVLVIPKNFESNINNFSPQKIEVYTILKDFSLIGSISSGTLKAAIAAINDSISNQLISKSAGKIDPAVLKQPVSVNDFVVIDNKQVNISPAAVTGFISSQTTFIPIILFLVIVFASQLIATSIASEKENKTLETLLSSPVSRKSIVAAKLVAAGFISLLTATAYLFGMRYYITGLSGGVSGGPIDAATKAAVAQLGLTFSTGDYVLLGLSLFFGILAALSVAIILGSFAEDTKAAQGVIAPLMVLILIPYFLTMLLDISSLSPAMRLFVYAIPFSHPFLAAPNILLDQYQNVWLGIVYLALFFLICVFIAAKIFDSDRIFTMKLNFKRKK